VDQGASGTARDPPERHGEGKRGGRGGALAGAGGPAALAAAHPAAPDCGGAGLALARGRPVAGAARRLPTVAHRLWLVPALAGGWRFRCLDAGDRPPAPSLGGPARGATPVHHRYASGQVHQRARAARVRCRQRVWGRKRVPLGMPPGTGSRSPWCRPRCRTAMPFRRWTAARRCGPACGKRSMTAPSRPSAAGRGRTCTACAIVSSRAIRRPKACRRRAAMGGGNSLYATDKSGRARSRG
jgi:hypothetical protein